MTTYKIDAPVPKAIPTVTKTVITTVAPSAGGGGGGSSRPSTGQMYPRTK